MKSSSCCLWSLLLFVATGCTYNPVHYDPVSGFQSGGGVGVMCGGPLDPWMAHCCPPNPCDDRCECGVRSCLESLFCSPCSCPAPACVTPACPTPVYPAPICPPATCPPVGMTAPVTPIQPGPSFAAPIQPMPTYAAPIQPMPTYAAPCPTCGPTPGAGVPHTTNYSQLFQSPPLAPPAIPGNGDPFMMPTPFTEPAPTANQLPPGYEAMDLPAQQPTPAPMPPMQTAPMNPQAPMPMNGVPMQQPMSMGINAMPTSYPQVMQTPLIPQVGYQPAPVMHDSRRQQFVPVRL